MQKCLMNLRGAFYNGFLIALRYVRSIREVSAKSMHRTLSSITGLTKAENGFMS